MHGQKRSEYKSRLLNPEAASNLATKAQQWNALSHELLCQRQRLSDPDSNQPPPSPQMLLSLTEKMLSVNPDPSHLWNVRREMLRLIEGGTKFDVGPELQLTARCLQRNPKAYSTWFHRKWSVAYMLSRGGEQSDQTMTVLEKELDLCAQFLMMDERNFHCWNYRRFVVAMLGSRSGAHPTPMDGNQISDDANVISGNSYNGSWSSWVNNLLEGEEAANEILMGAQIAPSFVKDGNHVKAAAVSKTQLNKLIMSEWDFTTSKIQDNFSNGSAFHYRSKLIPIVLEARLAQTFDKKSPSKSEVLTKKQHEIQTMAREEWEEILLNAIFTEPDDQTPWWYHRFIVAWAKPSSELKDKLGDEYNILIETYESLLFDMADSLRELLEVEKENVADGSVGQRDESKGVKCKWAYLGLHLVLSSLVKLKIDVDTAELTEEAQECLNSLIEIDPCRSERYKMLANEMSA